MKYYHREDFCYNLSRSLSLSLSLSISISLSLYIYIYIYITTEDLGLRQASTPIKFTSGYFVHTQMQRMNHTVRKQHNNNKHPYTDRPTLDTTSSNNNNNNNKESWPVGTYAFLLYPFLEHHFHVWRWTHCSQNDTLACTRCCSTLFVWKLL